MGFMSSREALAILPPEQLPKITPAAKRKATNAVEGKILTKAVRRSELATNVVEGIKLTKAVRRSEQATNAVEGIKFTKEVRSEQKTMPMFINPDSLFDFRVIPNLNKPSVSSGIVQDRGKPLKTSPVLPQNHLSSSPDRGLNIDALPSVSFSSPSTALATQEEKGTIHLSTSPLIPIPPTSALKPMPRPMVPDRSLLPGAKKQLGIPRDMAPWRAKRQ